MLRAPQKGVCEKFTFPQCSPQSDRWKEDRPWVKVLLHQRGKGASAKPGPVHINPVSPFAFVLVLHLVLQAGPFSLF